MKRIISKVIYSLLSIFLILMGVGLVFASSTDFVRSNLIVSEKIEDQDKFEAKPVKIFIPKLRKALNISDGFIVDNRWTVSDTGVSYLTTSSIPGDSGNSVLYGHNRKEILGDLWKVANGDLVYAVMNDGSFAKYEIFERTEIKPKQVEILENVGDSRLTIYTCSGFLDSARFVVVGRLIS